MCGAQKGGSTVLPTVVIGSGGSFYLCHLAGWLGAREKLSRDPLGEATAPEILKNTYMSLCWQMVMTVNFGAFLSAVVFNKNQAVFLKYVNTSCDHF